MESLVLNAVEVRVLGSLVEKEITTPDYYPLTLNALVNACNQSSNRDPVVSFDETTVVRALDGLREKKLALVFYGADSRVPKYAHKLTEALTLSRPEIAVLCVLLLRGPQTVGELRGRTERMHRFDELSDVLAGLQKLMDRVPPLAAVLPRQPGTKELRYAHLLSGPVESVAAAFASELASARREARPDATPDAAHEERIAQLEATVAELRSEFAELRAKIDDLFGNG